MIKKQQLFKMIRKSDESGVSGTGTVLEGVVFSDGTTVIRWCVDGKPNSTAIYPSFEDFELIHVTSHPTNGTEFNWANELPLGEKEEYGRSEKV